MRISIYFILFFLSVTATAENFHYRFQYSFIDIAEINISRKEILNMDEHIISEIKIKTKGPLKVFRNYQSLIKVIEYDSKREYLLNGIDRGKEEYKKIIYPANSIPNVIKFIDDGEQIPIPTIEPRDINAIDPISVLLKTIARLNVINSCDNQYNVYDGKRRYRASVEYIGDVIIKDQKKWAKSGHSIHCRVILDNFNNNSNEEGSYKQWPFEKKERILDIWFSSEDEFIPLKFNVKSPIGKITGWLTSN
jgi:hypothetical protein